MLIIQASIPMTGIKIFNILGALIQEIKIASQTASIDLSSYSNEMYFIIVRNEDGLITQKIIKNN